MRIYIAARYEHRREMVKIARELEDLGHEVTSRWLHGKARGARSAENAAYDLTDIVVADCLLVFTGSPSAKTPSGSHGRPQVEFGYALRAGKRLVVVGPRENLFHNLPAVEQFRSVKGLLDGLH